MRKKVCMIVPSFSAKGGIATVVNGYKKSQLEKKYDIRYIESYCDGYKLSKIYKAVQAYIIFLKEVIFNRPDLLHVHSSFGGSFYRKLPFIIIASWLNIPIINHIHGSDLTSLYINASKKKRKLVTKCFDRCTHLVVLSYEAKKKMQIVKTKTPITIIENYGIVHKDSLRQKNHIRKKILFLGFITELKGCLDIPEIACKIIRKCNNVEFILAGTGNVEEIKKILYRKKIDGYFSFPGWVRNEKKDNLFKEADIFFLPSYTEAMPMSILEAMGYGLPIVASDVGGIPQLIENGKNGFMSTPGDIDGFASNLLTLIKNSNLSYEMGKYSMKKLYKEYSLENHLEKIIRLYEYVNGDS